MTKKTTSYSQEFQKTVDECLLRHRSILDVLSKLHETSARVNRSVVKSVTDCGCTAIDAHKQTLPDNCAFPDWKTHYKTQITGELCENCRDVLEVELGHNLFYIAALCNSLGLNLEEIIDKETKRVATLGPYHLR